MKEIVYCSKCSYNGANRNLRNELCYYHENLSRRIDNDWFELSNTTIFRKMAYDINKNNDCDWFKEIELQF